MKKNLLAVLVMMLMLAPQSLAGAQKYDTDDRDCPERDEFKQTYEMTGGARVEVRGINGTVDVETWNGNTAEVHILRTGRTEEDLNYRKSIVEHTPSSIVVRNEKENERCERLVRQRVTVRLPRAVSLTVSGVNGRTNIGEVDG